MARQPLVHAPSFSLIVLYNKPQDQQLCISINLHEIDLQHGAAIGTQDWIISGNLVLFTYVLPGQPLLPAWRQWWAACVTSYLVLQLLQLLDLWCWSTSSRPGVSAALLGPLGAAWMLDVASKVSPPGCALLCRL